MSRPSIDLVHGPACCIAAFLEGRTYGRAEGLTEGYRRGYDACDQEIASLQRAAAMVVWSMANLPERDAGADAERARLRAAWWAARRGEGVES